MSNTYPHIRSSRDAPDHSLVLLKHLLIHGVSVWVNSEKENALCASIEGDLEYHFSTYRFAPDPFKETAFYGRPQWSTFFGCPSCRTPGSTWEEVCPLCGFLLESKLVYLQEHREVPFKLFDLSTWGVNDYIVHHFRVPPLHQPKVSTPITI